MRCRWFIAALVCVGCGRGGFDASSESLPSSQIHSNPNGDAEGTGLPPENDPAARVQVQNLGTRWVVPRAVEWTFETAGVASDLDEVVFAVADSIDDLVALDGSARLTRFLREQQEWPADFDLSVINRLVTPGLEPESTVYAQVLMIDIDGLTSATNWVELTTPSVPTNELIVFSEEPTPGYSIPAEIVHASSLPYAGTFHYEWRVTCPSGESSCFNWVRRQNVGVSTQVVPESAFQDGAHLEIALSYSADTNTGGAIRLYFEGPDEGDQIWFSRDMGLFGQTDYVIYQIPLRELINTYDLAPDQAPTVPYSTFATGVFEVGIGGVWQAGSVVRFDEVRIRW